MGGVRRHKSGMAKGGRIAARRLKVAVRRHRTRADIVNPWVDLLPRAAYFPYPFRVVIRLMEDVELHESIRGDGSRRRCAEVRQGLMDYRQFLRNERSWDDEVATVFAEAQQLLLHLSAREHRAAIGKNFEGHYDDEGGRRGSRSASAYFGFTIKPYLNDGTPNPIREEQRAQLWLSRSEPQLTLDAAFAKACEIAQMGIEDRRRLLSEIKQDLYRSKHRPRAAVPKKLTASQVLDIRNAYKAGGVSLNALGRRYDISGALVNQIVTGSTYKWVGGPVRWPGRPWLWLGKPPAAAAVDPDVGAVSE